MKLLKYKDMDKQIINRVIEICAEEWGISTQTLLGRSRSGGGIGHTQRPDRITQDHVRPRHTAMQILVEHFGMTQSDVARIFNKHHTSVIHALRSINALIGQNVTRGLHENFMEKYKRCKDRSIQLILTEAA